MAAYKAAVTSGISPLDFWSMTPYLVRLAMQATIDGKQTQSWILASLIRSRQMPKLEKLLTGNETKTKKDMSISLKSALSGVRGKKGRK